MPKAISPEARKESRAHAADKLPENPFLTPDARNCDLSFLTVEDSLLAYAVEHYEAQRRLRESIRLEYAKRKDRSRMLWDALVDEALRPFQPEDWMLPVSEIEKPGVIKGIYDYIPISETAPALYDADQRQRMRINRQQPWMILVTLNSRWHSSDAFLHWVQQEMVPELIKSARHVAMSHFKDARPGRGVSALRQAPGAASLKRKIRPPSLSQAPGAYESFSVRKLRKRLLALACHRIRHAASPDEPMNKSYIRYLEALPATVPDKVDLAGFIERVESVAADSRREWQNRLGDARRFRAAIESGLIQIL